MEFWSAVPGSQITFDVMREKDNKFVCGYTVTGKHTGNLIKICASNKNVKLNKEF